MIFLETPPALSPFAPQRLISDANFLGAKGDDNKITASKCGTPVPAVILGPAEPATRPDTALAGLIVGHLVISRKALASGYGRVLNRGLTTNPH